MVKIDDEFWSTEITRKALQQLYLLTTEIVLLWAIDETVILLELNKINAIHERSKHPNSKQW